MNYLLDLVKTYTDFILFNFEKNLYRIFFEKHLNKVKTIKQMMSC